MIYEIKRGAQIVWSGKAEGKQSRVIMQADMVEVTVKSPVAIAFQKGDTIKVYGETYKLNRPENIAKVNSQIGYTYTIEFEALYYDLGKWILYTLDGANQLTQPEVYLQGEARTILGLLVQNANRASSGWSLGVVDDTDVIQWTFSSAKLLTVLQDIADQTNLEFWVDGKTINLTRRQNNTGLSLAYGKGRGLYELARARREDPIVTHLTVAGGSQNIPNGYGHRNIQPTGGNPMVNPSYQAGQDRVEGVIVFENIYPRLNAKVTATSAINVIRSTDINFDLNAHLLDDGTSAQIAFTSGLLNGFTFTIAKDGYTHANRQILFNAIVDDNAYPQGIPNAQMKPAVGDTFVLLNINMPQPYVTASEKRVRDLGDQYFAEEGIEQYDWTGKLTPKFVLENAVELTLGGLVTLQAEDIGCDGSIRVDSYTRDLQQEYLYDFTLSNIITINKMVRERNMSDRLASTVSKGISQDGLSTKATYAERAGYAATAGHANTATSAATALRADHATNADNAKKAEHANTADLAYNSTKWNGLLQPDYLDQPVRKTDVVSFQGLIANEIAATQTMRIPEVANPATDALWKSGSYAMLGSAKVWAGRADLWNGLAQPDYLDQAVRKVDSPRFAGISSERFVSGFAGEGYRIAKDANGNIMAEFDRLTVRKDFTVYELIVNQIRATNGSLWVSDAIKIESVAKSGNNYTCKIDTDQGTIYVPFVVNDILRCQRFNGRSMKYYVARVTAANYADGTFTIVVIDGASIPAASDEVVRMGNTTDKNRQGAIYLTASDNGAPYIDVVDGVTSASLAGKVKARVGKLDGIIDADFGQLSGYGLYSGNVFLKGVLQVQAGSNVYTKTQADGNVSTAKSEAISSAASDATTKANNARTQAISAAATDAQTKANAARDAAINTANQFATNAINAINVGGRNLLRNSNSQYLFQGYNGSVLTRTGGISVSEWGAIDANRVVATGGSHVLKAVQTLITPLLDEVITVSGWFKNNGTKNINVYSNQGQVNRLLLAGESTRIVFENINGDGFGNVQFQFRALLATDNIDITWWRLKVEKGNKATDWTPAPEDITDALEVVRSETNTKFNVLETEINSKVSESNFNALGQRVSTAESTIVQQAGLIAQRVTKTEFDILNNTVNGINGRVTQAESSISQQADAISLRATKTEVSTSVNGAINTAASDATTKANNARTQAVSTAAADATAKAGNAKTQAVSESKTYTDGQITIQNDAINLRVTKTELNTAVADIVNIKDTRDDNRAPSWYYANYPLKTVREFKRGSIIGINGNYVQLTTYVPWTGNSGGNIIQEATASNGITYTRNGGAETWSAWVEAESTTGSQSKANTAQNNSKIYTDSQITVLDGKITLKSDKTVTDGLLTRMQSAEQKITPDAIISTVSSSVDSKIRDINIGGRNYQPDITKPESVHRGVMTILDQKSISVLFNNQEGSTPYIYFRPLSTIELGETYTLSFFVTAKSNTDNAPVSVYYGLRGSGTNDFIEQVTLDTKLKVVRQIIPTATATPRLIVYTNSFARGVTLVISDVKFEKGNKATDWSPAPEDVDVQIIGLDNRVSSTETTITQQAGQINLRATKTEMNSSVSNAIDNASSDATSKANNARTQAVSESKTYTDSQISIVNNAISLKSDAVTVNGINTRLQSAEAKVEPTAINLVVKNQVQSKSLGRMIARNPTFDDGNTTNNIHTNGLVVYDNANTGSVTITRQDAPPSGGNSQPTGKRFRLMIRHTAGGTDPWFGGVRWGFATTPSAVYHIKLIALLPAGRQLSFHTNSIGSGSTHYWLTSNLGTGKWEEYVYRIEVGSGSTSSTGFFSVMGGVAPTSSSPLVWYIAFATYYDANQADDTVTKDEVKSGIEMTAGGIKIFGETLSMNGMVTFNSLDTSAQNRITSADTKATNAQTSANTADSKAVAAQNTATTANGKANAAQGRINDWTTPNTTTIDGGKITANSITADKINVAQLFAQAMTATDITVTGNSKVGGFIIEGSKLKNSNSDTSLVFERLSNSAETWLRINENDSWPVLAIRTDQTNRSAISVSTYATGATGINVLSNLGGTAIYSSGTHEFIQRSGDLWNSPGVLLAMRISVLGHNTQNILDRWTTRGINSNPTWIANYTWRILHNIGHTDYVPLVNHIFTNGGGAGSIVVTEKTATTIAFQCWEVGVVNIQLIGRNKIV